MERDLLARLYAEHVRDLDRRYAAALQECGFDAVVVHSGTALKRSEFDDQYWPLRPVPHFQHWVPLAWPDCAVLIRPGQVPKLFRMVSRSYWEQPAAHDSDHWQGPWDIVDLTNPDAVAQHLPQGRVAFVGEDRARARAWGIADDAVNPPKLAGRLDRLRVHKSAYEVECLAEANRRAVRGHDALQLAFLQGDRTELDLHLLFLAATGQDDPETPYKNIVAQGRNAAVLHHVGYQRSAPSRSAESLLLDAGATFQGYAADITRTWVKGSGATADAFRALVDETERMQQRLCASVQVGLPYEELHEQAHRQVAGILREVGILLHELGPQAAGRISRAFFPHGLGHSLGLQCHDVGCALVKPKLDNPFLRNTSIIEAGQVFTIEPGIYFIPSLLDDLRAGPYSAAIDWRLVHALAELGGVRIEDDLFVTGGPDTVRNLTRESFGAA